MRQPARFRYLPSVVAGAVLPLAFAPFGQFWLAPLCIAALFFAWRGAAPRQAALAGFLFGFAAFLFGIYWIWISVHDVNQAPAALALLLTGGLVAAMAVYPALVGWIAARWLGTDGGRVWLLALPAIWVLFEWLRGWVLTGFGWLAVGYSQTDSWLVALAPVLGLLGVSYAAVLLGGALLTMLCGTARARVAAGAVAVAVIAGAFVLRGHEWTEARPRELSVALVQGAVPQEDKWQPAQLPRTLALYAGLTADVLGRDLILWPEAAIPALYENMSDYLGEVERAAAAAGSTVMLGMLRYHAETGASQNSVFALGHPELVYDKRHLVPYGEYFPVPDAVRAWLRSMSLPNVDTVPGAGDQQPFPLLGEQIAITICYEDVFGAEQLGSFPAATLLVNVSNDAWFGDSIAADQHLQIARMRAAEVGRYMLRATNTGVTAVIDPHGRVIDRLPQFEPGTLTAAVRGYTGATPYVVWGDRAIVLTCLLALCVYFAMTKFTMRPGT